MAEHMSCTNPGSVISPDRVPPPIWSHASSNKTCFPACARVIPADSPFGPEPTITASYDMRCLRKKLSANGRGGDRTLTGVTPHGILSPVRLPIPPLGPLDDSYGIWRPQLWQRATSNLKLSGHCFGSLFRVPIERVEWVLNLFEARSVH